MSLPVARSVTELRRLEGRRLQVRGSYGAQDLRGHAIKVKGPDGRWKKIRRVAFVKLENGCVVELENRPNDEMNALDGREVIATGKLIIPPDPPAHPIMARPEPVPTLVEITSIEALVDEAGE